ncbi:MAG TPA: FUSC family membrane protein [Casimicrobiaceae bacterium]
MSLRPLARIPAYLVNGVEVALGVMLVNVLASLAGGSHAALFAATGAVCASLADVPNTAARIWRRVAIAATLSCFASVVVQLSSPWPSAQGIAIALIGGGGFMTLAYGPRAAAIAFAPVLAIVFAMAVPVPERTVAFAFGWNVMGSAVYLLWAVLAVRALEGSYRRDALANAIDATARLLRTRARMLRAAGQPAERVAALREWVARGAALADRLQLARDFVFVAADSPANRRETAILLHLIDIRDVLFASRLDVNLLGADAAGLGVRTHLAGGLEAIAAAIDASRAAMRGSRGALESPDARPDLSRLFATVPLAAADPRGRLMPALAERWRRLAAEVAQIGRLVGGADEAIALSRDELAHFVARDSWSIRAFGAHLTLRSPVLRLALRMGLALGVAYLVARLMPWGAHPAWVVLSVAVVLRGSLDQTLARRNARVLGTLIGCLVVVLLFEVRSAGVLNLVFIVSVAIAHAFVGIYYMVTAIAATVMALIQQHLADPHGGFAIGERIADTLLGALLAWGFSYVLPSWERRTLPQIVERALQALGGYAEDSLGAAEGAYRDEDAHADESARVGQRLSRRRAYDAVGAVEASFRRSAAEPQRVRVPVDELAAFIDHAQRLMAHLSVIRLSLARRSDWTRAPDVVAAIADARAGLAQCLRVDRAPAADEGAIDPFGSLPADRTLADRRAWFLRRLRITVDDARRAGEAARRLLATP